MTLSKWLSRLLKGYISAIVVALLVRLLQLYRNQRKLLEANINLVKGKHFILGSLKEFETDRLRFIESLFQSNSTEDVCPFICGGPVNTLFSVRSKVVIERLLQDVVAQVSSNSPDVKAAHDTVVGASLHHIRNWDQGKVCLFDEFTELLSKVLCHIFLRSKLWQAQYGEIRSALISEKYSHVHEWKLVLEALKGKSAGDFSKASYASRSNQLAKLSQVLSTLPENPKVKTASGDEKDAPSSEDLAFQLWESFHLVRSILTWTSTNLALYPSYQDDLVREIDGLVGRRVPPMIQEMRSLPQLDAFIQETLRLRAPIPLSYAKANETLTVGEFSLPKSSQVVLALSLANTSTQVFDQPNEFIPSRIFEEDFKSKFIPPPSGMLNLSLVVAKALLVVILQKYRITLDQSQPVSLAPMLINNFSVPDKNLACLFETRKIGPTL